MSSVKVGIKFRPLNDTKNETRQWIVQGNQIQSKNSKHKFSFSNVFDESSNNRDVYTLCSPIVQKSLNGYNGTILTYGQTSSGKTYTMMGDSGTKGIIEMAIDDIFDTIDELNDKTFSLRVGFIEIYNEKVYDLLDRMRNELRVFEYQGQLETNQKVFHVRTKDEIMKYMMIGNKNKHIASTVLNEVSSRSHTIFSISIDSTDEMGETKSSKLIFGDLAGSEKPDATKSSFNEGLHINKSLLALGKIIRELSKSNVNVKNIRFRDSLLTRLLACSLGGNSYTSIICTASPSSLEETFNTICFARNAERTKCKPMSNSIMDSTREVSILKDKVQKLQKELDFERSRILESTININTTFQVTSNTVRRNENLKRKFCIDSQESIIENNEHPTKIYIQTDITTAVKDKETIEDLKQQLASFKSENEELKARLHESNQNLENIAHVKDALRSNLKEESHKGWKLKEKCKTLRHKLMQKKEKLTSIMAKSSSNLIDTHDGLDNSTFDENLKAQYESDITHKNLIIIGLEAELKKVKEEVAKRNKQLVTVAVNTESDPHEAQRLEQKNYNLQHMIHDLNRKVQDLLFKNQVLQSEVDKINSHASEIARERDEFKKINSSMKANFQDSLKNTRAQFHSLLEQKQKQQADFKKQLNDIKNEELRNHLKLQEHYEKQFGMLKNSNQRLEAKIEILEEELKERTEIAIHNSKIAEDFLNDNGTEKFKFIKTKFEKKLSETVKFFERLLDQKEKELNDIKKLNKIQNSNNFIDQFVAVNLN